MAKSEKIPTLFADFPLVGSELFPFPCYLNSHLFWPNDARSSIGLKSGQKSRIN